MRSRAHRRFIQGSLGVSISGLLTLAGCAGAGAGMAGSGLSANIASTPAVAPAASPAASTAAPADAPTYYKDVLPVIAANCVECHQPRGMNLGGMVAPMSFTTYESTKPWAKVMALRVKEGYMPPWDAHPIHKGTFVGERYLSDADKQTIIDWADAGAPAGDPADAPEIQLAKVDDTARGEWWIGKPDIVLDFHEPYFVEDGITDLNVGVNLEVPDTYTEPHWIKASEMHAGAPYVHHICGEPFGCIAPGWDPYVYPDGYAMLLPPIKEIRLGMHYHKTPGPGTGFYDNSRVAVIFYQPGDTIHHLVHRSVLSVGEDFVIPAGDPDFSITREFDFDVDTYILSLTPHMHYRGKEAKYELEYPDGTRKLLLYVPHYDFNWQRKYVFKDPPVAPAGSKLLWTATWDNSTDNAANPDPNRDVPWGQPTTDEMGNGWLDYTPVEPINLVVGRDPVPEDMLAEVTQQLDRAAQRDAGRVVDGKLETTPAGEASTPASTAGVD